MDLYDLNTPVLIKLGVKYLEAKSTLMEDMAAEKLAFEDVNSALTNHEEAYTTGFNPGAILVAKNILDSNTKNYNRCRDVRMAAQDVEVQTYSCLLNELAFVGIQQDIDRETYRDEELHDNYIKTGKSVIKASRYLIEARNKYDNLVLDCAKEENSGS